jgi:hypothetical protein
VGREESFLEDMACQAAQRPEEPAQAEVAERLA